ncbi:MAG TPA: flagellar biosynthesis protein FlhB [Epulopiscium sp.]|nr:flagellar biosynthesis protein FlhB [Candidatus Epulonipiscium sp.]
MKTQENIKLVLNLQFFSAESEGRTEKGSSKKRTDARKKGQVAKSIEINTAFLFIAAFWSLKTFGSYMKFSLEQIFIQTFNKISSVETFFEAKYMSHYIATIFLSIIKIVAPVLIPILITGIGVSVMQVGWKPSLEPMTPKFSKLNPLSGFKRMFSSQSLMELLKATFKVVVLGTVIYSRIKTEIPTFLLLIDMSLIQILSYVGELVISIGFRIAMIFIFMAVADFAYQKHKFEDSIKMTKQEVKDEYKQAEGDPQLKGKIKQKMREMSMKRMMQSVPEADVIITNPTHYAVAIQYSPEKGTAPIVTAKGADYIAQKIREKAAEHDIQIIENKPLARTLYAVVEIGDEIPPDLYKAVAEILAFIYNLKNT